MNTPLKTLLVALLTGLLAWLTYNATCRPSGDASAVAGNETTAAAPVPEAPASAEAIASCQGDINTLMTNKTINFQ